MKCFVYGTLLKGMQLYECLWRAPCIGLAFTWGDLYDLGEYPGMIQGNGLVYGEVYKIDNEILEGLDQIEGVFPGQEEYCLYLRKEITSTLMKDGKTIKAWAYFYNRNLSKATWIQHGDYRRHRAESESHRQWYIAYGSNMNSERLRDRVGEPMDSVAGYLDGFRLVFNKQGFNDEVYANIQSADPEEKCPFVAYCLTMEQLQRLDKCEGEPDHYVRLGYPFFDAKGRYTHLGHIYVARSGRLVEEQKPSACYLEHIKAGYEEHGFDTSLINLQV